MRLYISIIEFNHTHAHKVQMKKQKDTFFVENFNQIVVGASVKKEQYIFIFVVFQTRPLFHMPIVNDAAWVFSNIFPYNTISPYLTTSSFCTLWYFFYNSSLSLSLPLSLCIFVRIKPSYFYNTIIWKELTLKTNPISVNV